MADFSLLLKSDWTEAERIERTLRAVENLTSLDTLSLDDAGDDRSEANLGFAAILKSIEETFGSRVQISTLGKRKAKVQIASGQGCDVCGGGGRA